MSSHVTKPIPPIIIKSIITTLIKTEDEMLLVKNNALLHPLKSKPALQKADIE